MNATADKVDWRRVAARMWAAQSRADLNERPRLLLAWLIYGTVECGRVEILVTDMNELFAHLGIGKNHHREVRVALMDARMVEFKQAAAGWRVTVFPDPAGWTCGWYHDADAKARWLERLNSLPGQCQGELLPAEPSLTKALAEVGAESAQFPKWEPMERAVPKMGTPCTQVTGTPVKPAFNKAGITGEQVRRGTSEQDVLNRLEKWLAESPFEEDRNDFDHWSGYWRMKVVRPNPDQVARILDDFQARQKEGWEASKSRVGALKDLLKRWN